MTSVGPSNAMICLTEQASVASSCYQEPCETNNTVNRSIALNLAEAPKDESYENSLNELKSLLPKFAKTWSEIQKSIYSKGPDSSWKEDLKSFYIEFWEAVEPRTQAKINENSIDLFNQEFTDLNVIKKLSALNSVFESIKDKKKLQFFFRKIFAKLETKKQENIIKASFILLGDVIKLKKLMPSNVIEQINLSLNNSIKEFMALLNDNRIKYLGRGSIGAGFLVDLNGHKFVLKVPIAQQKTPGYQTFCYEQDALKKYEEILDKYPSSPERDFIPRLIKDSFGEYLCLEGKVIVMKYQEGRKIIETVEIPADNSSGKKQYKYKSTNDYIRMGLDDKFLMDYIGFYIRFAKEGADLGDISPWNYLHNGNSLSFFELAGFDPNLASNSAYKSSDEHRKQYPEAFCIYSLLTAIVSFERDTKKRYEKQIIGAVAKKTFGLENIDQFFGHRIVQLARVLQKSVNEDVISLQDLRKGFADLEKLLDQYKRGNSFTLTGQGHIYLCYLKELVDKEGFCDLNIT
jgi:hypothetical protein